MILRDLAMLYKTWNCLIADISYIIASYKVLNDDQFRFENYGTHYYLINRSLYDLVDL